MGKGVSDAAEAAEEAERPETDTVRLGNGVVLKVKGVPLYVIRSAIARLPKPAPPRIKPREDRDYEEDNPDDPAFQQQLKDQLLLQVETISDTTLALGTEIQHLPEGVHGPESEDWVDEEAAQFAGFRLELEGKYQRYLSWLKYYAIGSLSELERVSAALRERIGLSEKEVADTVDSFPGRTVGRADNGVSPKAVETGIAYLPIVPGVVPEVEEREAARFNGYTWKEWLKLNRQERVDGVAYFRIRRYIEMHQEDAKEKDMARRIKTRRRK